MTQPEINVSVQSALKPQAFWWRIWTGADDNHLRCGSCDAALDGSIMAVATAFRCGICGTVIRRTDLNQPVPAKVLHRKSSVSSDGPADLKFDLVRLFGIERQQIGNYLLERELARGGTAVVYLGRHPKLKKQVAVKLLLPNPELKSQQLDRRLFREALTLAQFRHPHIVPVLDAGTTPEGIDYLVMDYVDGEDLSRKLQREGPLPWRSALTIMKEILAGIDFAHAHGVIHRDLKPANILLDKSGHVQIADFGLARDEHAQTQLTRTGTALGTPAYMSPEQAQGDREAIGRRSDIYSLGAILYELLTGRPPFCGHSAMEVLYKVIHELPVPPGKHVAALPSEIEAICLISLDKSPDRRYHSVYQMLTDIEACLKGERPPHAYGAKRGILYRALKRSGLKKRQLLFWGCCLLALLVWAGTQARKAQRLQACLTAGEHFSNAKQWDEAEAKFLEARNFSPQSVAAYEGYLKVRKARRAASERDTLNLELLKDKLGEALTQDPARVTKIVNDGSDAFSTFIDSLLRPVAELSQWSGARKAAGSSEDTLTAKLSLHSSAPCNFNLRQLPAKVSIHQGSTPAVFDVPPGLYLLEYRVGTAGEFNKRLLEVNGSGLQHIFLD